jgi:CelD/BcsL family acetyltransferase involved in cellulose biosynthesis
MSANAQMTGARGTESLYDDTEVVRPTISGRGIGFWSTTPELLTSWSTGVASEESGEPFFQPYWFSSFAQTLARHRSVHLVVAQQGQKVLGALPLMRQRTFFGGLPARTLHSLSNVHSCRFDLSFSSAHKEGAAHAIWNALRADETWDVIEAQHVPVDGGFESLLKLAAYDGFLIGKWPTLLSPYMNIPPKGGDIFADCPERFAGFRRTHLKSLKKLEKQGRVTCTSISRFDSRFFDTFMAMEGAGWKGHVGGAITCNPVVESFYRTVLSAASEAGHLLCHSLNLDGRPIAMDIGLMMNGRYYSPKIAYDEGFAKYSPGQLLIRQTIQHVAEMGGHRYDFVGPRSHHKAFWTETVREHATYYIFRASWPGFARYVAAMKIGARLRRLKRLRYGDPQDLKTY